MATNTVGRKQHQLQALKYNMRLAMRNNLALCGNFAYHQQNNRSVHYLYSVFSPVKHWMCVGFVKDNWGCVAYGECHCFFQRKNLRCTMSRRRKQLHYGVCTPRIVGHLGLLQAELGWAGSRTHSFLSYFLLNMLHEAMCCDLFHKKEFCCTTCIFDKIQVGCVCMCVDCLVVFN